MCKDGGQAFPMHERDDALQGMSYRQWLVGTVGNPPRDYPWPKEPDLGPGPAADDYKTDGGYDRKAYAKALDDRQELCKHHKRRRCLDRAMEWRKGLADRIIAEDENA